MDIFTLAMWAITLIFLIVSFIKNRDESKGAIKKALGMGKGMAKSLILIILLIGLILAYLPPSQISDFVAKQNLYVATIFSAIFGTITLIPAFIAFPLVGSLVDANVSIVPSVAFLTTLTMVGVVTYPLEKKTFGSKFAITRNILSFSFAIIIALFMGVIL
jgi:uncharacterized membrane protein YraQ (UPF0718 family)